MDSKVNDRLEDFILERKSNMTALAKDIGVSPTVIMNICRGRRSKPSYEVLYKLLSTYTELNAKWLITGEGSMYYDDTKESGQLTEDKIASVSALIGSDTDAKSIISKLLDIIYNLTKT